MKYFYSTSYRNDFWHELHKDSVVSNYLTLRFDLKCDQRQSCTAIYSEVCDYQIHRYTVWSAIARISCTTIYSMVSNCFTLWFKVWSTTTVTLLFDLKCDQRLSYIEIYSVSSTYLTKRFIVRSSTIFHSDIQCSQRLPYTAMYSMVSEFYTACTVWLTV